MLRIRTYAPCHALGQVAYSSDIVSLVRAVPDCFTSKQILPAVNRAMSFAKSVPLDGLDDAARARSQSDLDQAWYKLSYWQQRLASEPEKKYCEGTTDGVPSSDHYQIVQALVGPFQAAAGISAAQGTLAAARAGLISDLTSPSQWLPNLSQFTMDLPAWAKIAGVVAAGLVVWALVSRIRGPRAQVVKVEASK